MVNDCVRAAFIAPYFGIGGIERTFLTIAENLSKKGFQFYFVNLSGNVFQKRFLDAGECFFSADYTDVIRFLRSEQIHIVQTASCDEGSYLAYLAQVPCIVERPDGLSTAFLTDKRPVDCIVASTESVYESARKKYPKKQVTRIFNGVDTAVFSPQNVVSDMQQKLGISSNDLVIGYCGRLAEQKCLERLIEVFNHVHQTHHAVKLLIVGDEFPRGSGYKTQLVELTNTLGITDSVVFAGSWENPARLLNLFSIAVNCSGSFQVPDGTYETEGIPNSVMEAMAVGLPVVATDSGDTHLLVRDARNGFLVDPHDWKTFGDKLMCLLENPRLRAEMGQASREIILQEFTKEKMLDAYEQLYHDLVSDDWTNRYPNARSQMKNHFIIREFQRGVLSQKPQKILLIRSGSAPLCDWTVDNIQRNSPDSELHVLCHEKNYQDVKKYSAADIIRYNASPQFEADLMDDIVEQINAQSFDMVIVLFNDLLGKEHARIIELFNRMTISQKIIVNRLCRMYIYESNSTQS